MLWDNVDGITVCRLCAHRCRIGAGKAGVCGVRVNDGGTLRALTYGRAVAVNVDPIEKKPLYHFLPSTETFSVAAAGCNFRCDFCQNSSISQVSELRGGVDRYGDVLMPEEIVRQARRYKCESVSFTYTEPTVFFEYALDTMRIAKEAGLKTIFVSNGYMTPECLEAAGPYLDACNIDLKSFRDDFYRKRCGASLQPVLESLKAIYAKGIWLEVTTLVIADENDSEEELAAIAEFIRGELGPEVPWHVSRFFPRYRMSEHSPTSVSAVIRAADAGRAAGLRHVYAGNV
jgi:pyruvate formate lyase activating enzyme